MFVHLAPHVEKNVRRDACISQATHDVHDERQHGDAGERTDDADQGSRVGADQRRVDQDLREVGDEQREDRSCQTQQDD